MQSTIYIDGKKVDKDKLNDIEITNDNINRLIAGFIAEKGGDNQS